MSLYVQNKLVSVTSRSDVSTHVLSFYLHFYKKAKNKRCVQILFRVYSRSELVVFEVVIAAFLRLFPESFVFFGPC